MTSMSKELVCAAGLGAVAGMRSQLATALVSRHLAHHPSRAFSRTERRLARPWTARLLTAFAAAEMLGDKLPFIPNRTEPIALAGRASAGAFAAAAASSKARWAAAIVGAASAVGATFAAFRLRRAFVRRFGVPDALVAIGEDALALAIGRALVR